MITPGADSAQHPGASGNLPGRRAASGGNLPGRRAASGGNLPGRRAGWDLFEFNRWLDISGLPPLAQLVLTKMMFVPVRGSDGLADSRDLSGPALARRCEIKSNQTIERIMRLLEDRGALTVVRRGRGKRSAYLLHMPSPVDNSMNLPDGRGSASGSLPDERGGTSPMVGEDLPDGRGTSFPFLTEVPSIVERVRARVRGACPDLTPDDDDLDLLIKNLENRTPNPVSNVAGYLLHCPPADIRRLLAEAKPQVRPARMEAWTEDEAPECPHGNPGGVTSAGTPRCPQCRRAAQRGRSGPFSPSLDGLDRPGGPKPADGLSEPQPPEAVAG